MEAAMKKDMGELLDHVPVLVRAYGKWPSYCYLVMATALQSKIALLFGSIAVGLLYKSLR
jgi:hypothetical protein